MSINIDTKRIAIINIRNPVELRAINTWLCLWWSYDTRPNEAYTHAQTRKNTAHSDDQCIFGHSL